MMWVWVFLGVGLLALVVTIAYGFWLFRKASELWSEIVMLGRRAEELSALLDQLEPAPDVEAARARLNPRELVLIHDDPAHRGGVVENEQTR